MFNKIVSGVKGIVSKFGKAVGQVVSNPVVRGAAVAGGAISMARADDTTNFDYTSLQTTLTTGLGVVGSVAAGIAAIAAGVMVWKKIKSYFSKAG